MARDDILVLEALQKITTALEQVNAGLGVNLEMYRSISNQIAINNKLTIEAWQDIKAYRTEREKAESEKQATTEEKINKVLDKKFEFWYYFRERVMPAVIIAVILAILKKLNLI